VTYVCVHVLIATKQQTKKLVFVQIYAERSHKR